ncbi:MAG: dienelactone hydrolase family protein [Candidatus Gracilibacteria bacterium]|nr:dienelactone hydrolase family protein [Candidatus Gracilibacteria bacterium]
MKKIIIFLLLGLFIVGCTANDNMQNGTQTGTTGTTNTGQTNDIDDLSKSERHQEWVQIDNNGKTINTWVVYPESDENSSVVLLIHENKGLTDWVRNIADKLAAEGYIVVAPDLLSGYSENMQETSDFETEDAATKALYSIEQETITSDLMAVQDYAGGIDASNGKIAVVGFCWGGIQAFNFATQASDLDAVLVFYGTAPEDENVYDEIEAPVYGFYGGDDTRVNSTLGDTINYMEQNQKTFNYEIYNGAGHAFMRTGETSGASETEMQARDRAWDKMLDILENI